MRGLPQSHVKSLKTLKRWEAKVKEAVQDLEDCNVIVEYRSRRLVNTDPQRRCYNGCHFSSELIWTNWEILEYTTESNLEDRLKYWRELNDYAISQRGESARSEYRRLK